MRLHTMARTLLFLFIQHFLSFYAFSQTGVIKLQELSPNTYCTTKKVTLKFTTTTVFNKDNKFKIQLANFSDNIYKDVESNYVDGNLSFEVPNFQDFVFQKNPVSFYVKIKSTDPEIVSNSIPIKFHTAPNVFLSGQISTNPYTSINIPLQGKGTWPTSLTLEDGSSFSFDQYFDPSFNISTGKSKDIKISTVGNQCGLGTSSGLFSVKVNPIAVKIVSLSMDYAYCRGSDFYVVFSKTGNFNVSNNFKVQVKGGSSTPFVNFPTTAISDSVLKVTIPLDFKNDISELRVTGSSPEVVSESYQKRILLTDQFVDLVSTPNTSSIQNYYSVIFKGVGPFEAKLNDGTVISSTKTGMGEYGERESRIIPLIEKPFTYKIISARGGCGEIPLTQNNTVQITPDSLLYIDLKADNTIYGICLNTGRFEIPINSNIPNLDNGHDLKIRILYLDFYGSYYKSKDFNASISNDKKTLVANIPLEELKNLKETSIKYRIIDNKLKILSPIKEVSFSDVPSLTNITASNKILDKPEEILLGVAYTGGRGLTTIELNDNSVKTINGAENSNNYFSVFPQETTVYKIKSISNSCGRVNNPKLVTPSNFYQDSVKIYVTRPLSYSFKIKSLPKKGYCPGEIINVAYETIGQASVGTNFKVEIYNHEFSTTVGTGNSNSIAVKIPENVNLLGKSDDSIFYQKLRIKDENGLVLSNSVDIKIFTKPKATLSDYNYTYNKKLILNEVMAYDVSLSGGGTFYKYVFENFPEVYLNTENISRNTYKDYNISFIPKREGIYTIKSVENDCGVGEVKGNGLYVQPFNVLLTNWSGVNFCEGASGQMPINYLIHGDASKANLGVQASINGQDNFKDLKIIRSGNPIWVQIPEGMFKVGSSLEIRIYDKNSNFVSEKFSKALLGHPTISLTANDGNSTTGILKENEASYSCIRINSSNPYESKVWIDGVGEISSNACFTVSPKVNTVYKIQKVSSICGYSDSNAQFTVKVPNSAKVSILNNSSCAGGSLKIDYTIRGEFLQGSKFDFILENVSNPTLKSTVLNFTKLSDSNLSLEIPSSIKGGYYYLYIINNNQILGEKQLINVAEKAVLEIFGNSTINSNQKTYVTIKSAGSVNGISYVLSNGTTGQLYSNISNIVVSPLNTTTFTIKNASNICGQASVSGEAKVIVNPKTNQEINAISLNRQNVCVGEKLTAFFTTVGIENGTIFKLQLSDKLGSNFKPIPSSKNGNGLDFFIPNDTPEGSDYKIKIITDNTSVSSSTSVLPLNIRAGIGVKVIVIQSYFTTESPAVINFELEGTPPFRLIYDDSLAINKANYNVTSNKFTVNISKPGNYRVQKISNNFCSDGIISGENPIKIGVLTANENLEPESLSIFPNPTNNFFEIRGLAENTTIKIKNILGVQLKSINIDESTTSKIDISDLESATYFIEIIANNRTIQTLKVIKL